MPVHRPVSLHVQYLPHNSLIQQSIACAVHSVSQTCTLLYLSNVTHDAVLCGYLNYLVGYNQI